MIPNILYPKDGPSTRILLVDGHKIVRNGIRFELSKHGDLILVGETGDGQEAVWLAKELRPDVIVLENHLAGLNGVQVVERVLDEAKTDPDKPEILVYSAHHDKQYIWGLLAAGARGYLLKSDPIEQLPSAIRLVGQGKGVLSPLIQTHLIELIQQLKQPLSRTETRVLELVAHGKSNRDIAAELDISEGTVKTHLHNTYRKVPWIRSRAEATSWAWLNRIVRD